MAKTNPWTLAKAITDQKGNWEKATTNEQKEAAAKTAKPYYEQLRSLGYGNLAEKLSKSNSHQAARIASKADEIFKTEQKEDSNSKQGLFGVRDGLVNVLNNKYDAGIKDSDIKYDGNNVHIKGYVIPKDKMYFSKFDDKHYISGENLNTIADDFAKNTGLLLSEKARYDKYDNATFDTIQKGIKSADFTSWISDNPIMQAVLGDYREQGEKEGANIEAESAANNNGNINSYGFALSEDTKAKMNAYGIDALKGVYDSEQENYKDWVGIASDEKWSHKDAIHSDKERETQNKITIGEHVGSIHPDIEAQYNPYKDVNFDDVDITAMLNTATLQRNDINNDANAAIKLAQQITENNAASDWVDDEILKAEKALKKEGISNDEKNRLTNHLNWLKNNREIVISNANSYSTERNKYIDKYKGGEYEDIIVSALGGNLTNETKTSRIEQANVKNDEKQYSLKLARNEQLKNNPELMKKYPHLYDATISPLDITSQTEEARQADNQMAAKLMEYQHELGLEETKANNEYLLKLLDVNINKYKSDKEYQKAVQTAILNGEYDKEIATIKKGGAGNVTDEMIKLMDSAIKNINNKFNIDSGDDNLNPIEIDGNGYYRMKNGQDVLWYADVIAYEVLNNQALDIAAKESILKQLGIPNDVVAKYADATEGFYADT